MKRIIFMGTPDFSVPILKQLTESEYEVVLVVTQPDRPKGRKRVITPPPVKELATEVGLPVLQPENVKEAVADILAYEPDLIVTAAYGQILPKELLEGPIFGCINVHASLLPELRGGAPIHYSIIQGKKETGVTIMYMVEKLDAGDMIDRVVVPIEETDHVGILHDKLSAAGSELLMATLPKLFAGDIQTEQQDEAKATFASNITREDERIDWHKTHREIYNQIRGLHPWPVAHTLYEGKNIKIWWAQPVDNLFTGNPGEIIAKTDETFAVICGDQKAVEITEIQPSGSKKMSVKEYLQGNTERIKIGIQLGE